MHAVSKNLLQEGIHTWKFRIDNFDDYLYFALVPIKSESDKILSSCPDDWVIKSCYGATYAYFNFKKQNCCGKYKTDDIVEISINFDQNTFNFKMNHVDYGNQNTQGKKIPKSRFYVSSRSTKNRCTFLEYKKS